MSASGGRLIAEMQWFGSGEAPLAHGHDYAWLRLVSHRASFAGICGPRPTGSGEERRQTSAIRALREVPAPGRSEKGAAARRQPVGVNCGRDHKVRA